MKFLWQKTESTLKFFFKHSNQNPSNRLLAVAVILSLASANCAKKPTEQTQSIDDTASVRSSDRSLEQTQIKIQDENGYPIAGAFVMVGLSENSPFEHNTARTNQEGIAVFDTKWNQPLPLTIEASGFVRATYFDTNSASHSTFILKNKIEPSTYELSGSATGFGPLPRDGFVDAGLIFPAISASKANTLQLTHFISTEVDTIEILGREIHIPSNVTLPTQRETYVFPITLSKPSYRIQLPSLGEHKIEAAHIRFPLREVVGELRSGKTFFDVINYFQFMTLALHDVTLNSEKNRQDLNVDNVKLTPKFTFSAPNFNPQYAMIGLSLAEQDGLYYIADVKRLHPNERQTLMGPKNTEQAGKIVSILRLNDKSTVGAKSEQLSAVSGPTDRAQTLQFLSMIEPPKQVDQKLILRPPTSLANVQSVFTYASLLKIERIENGKIKLERKTPQWDLYSRGWVNQMPLPVLPTQIEQSASSMRWLVTYGGEALEFGFHRRKKPRCHRHMIQDMTRACISAVDSQPFESFNLEEPLGPQLLQKASHVTQSASDF